ncbi:MAG TPA: lauroyl acyltransferase, partial [Rhodospirillales bacterium]|nr:lauroyl acyltransferase [Rhodospirillales bacterium]
AIMTRINQQLEQWIRDKPAQWLWLHNRWPD